MGNKLRTFLVRVAVVYVWHLLIKWGDETFYDFFDFTWRGILLCIYVIVLWVFALYLLDWIKLNFFKRKKWFSYLLFHIVYGYTFALLTNIVYRYVDVHYFKTDWGDIGYLNPTLTLALTFIFITNMGVYENFKADITAKENEIKAEKLEKENAIAHYKLLKAQIEPHFLFNSLSVLSSLVHKDADLAEEFILKLSKLMRFAIEQTDSVSVTLQEELDFMMHYFFLIKIRFGDAIYIENQLNLKMEEFILPPYTLQTLIENAMQHNKFNPENPLGILLRNDLENIYVENNVTIKTDSFQSTGIGLDNLNKRMKHFNNKKISTEIRNGKFSVKIPLIPIPNIS